MNSYWLETGACLVMLWLLIILIGAIAFSLYYGLWVLALLLPAVVYLVFLWWDLWITRPSLKRL